MLGVIVGGTVVPTTVEASEVIKEVNESVVADADNEKQENVTTDVETSSTDEQVTLENENADETETSTEKQANAPNGEESTEETVDANDAAEPLEEEVTIARASMDETKDTTSVESRILDGMDSKYVGTDKELHAYDLLMVTTTTADSMPYGTHIKRLVHQQVHEL